MSLGRQENSKKTVLSFAKVGAPHADNDSSSPPEVFHNFFLLKVLIEIHYIVIANCTFNLYLFYQCTQDGKSY